LGVKAVNEQSTGFDFNEQSLHWQGIARYYFRPRWFAGSMLAYQTNFDKLLRQSAGVELGWVAAKNLWLQVGYNIYGFKDEDFADTYTEDGFYFRLRYKFGKVFTDAKPLVAVEPVVIQSPKPVPVVIEKPEVLRKTFNLSSDSYFDFAKASLSEERCAMLQKEFTTLEDAQWKKIRIIGHTDRIGSAANNVILSKKRADSVALCIGLLGIDQGFMYVQGMGYTQPSGKTEFCRKADGMAEYIKCLAPDRRVTVELEYTLAQN
jgi:OOP family OmpA-OmpF porin